MRYLEFNKENEVSCDMYEIIYDGILASNKPITWDAETRVVEHLLDALEELGVPTIRGVSATFALSKSGTVVIEDVEYMLMLDILKEVRWKTGISRTVNKTVAFLRDAPSNPPVSEAKPEAQRDPR
jgi:hypothetical protein